MFGQNFHNAEKTSLPPLVKQFRLQTYLELPIETR